jgi:hypothetical protein
MDQSVFEFVADILPGLVPDELGTVHLSAHRYGVKVWFGADKASREHYEAQLVAARDVPGAKVAAIEVGFHAEHTKEKENEAVLAHLLESEKKWRKAVGKEPDATVFLGRATHWRRVSEIWPDPDMDDTDLAFEIAARLTDYVTALEPALRARSSS